MAVTISFNEVLTFILLVAGIALLVYLVITASNINSILKVSEVETMDKVFYFVLSGPMAIFIDGQAKAFR